MWPHGSETALRETIGDSGEMPAHSGSKFAQAIGLALSNGGPVQTLSEILWPIRLYFLFSAAPTLVDSVPKHRPAAIEWPRGIARSHRPDPLRSKACARSSSRTSPLARSISVSVAPFP